MLTLSVGIAAEIVKPFIDGVYWLVELALDGGTQYWSDSGVFSYGGHTWNPTLDPEEPVSSIEYHLQCDQKVEATINLVNVNHGISDLLKTNDPQGKTCKIYIYFADLGEALQVFQGEAGKPERVTETVISLPVTSFLHGPRTKLPSCVFACTCRFQFADGVNCPYDPAGGVGVVDPGTGVNYTSCPKSGAACEDRGMRDVGGSHIDYFGGFEQWISTATGKLNNSGFLGIGRSGYSSSASVNDNFLGQAIPLVYGKVKVPCVPFFNNDESEFRLCGGFIGDGKLMIDGDGGFIREIKANGQSTHDFAYPPFVHGGYIGQYVPAISGYTADPFSGTAFTIIRIKDEVGLQPTENVDMTAKIQGRVMTQYWWDTDHWEPAYEVYTYDPLDVFADLICNPRGGLGKTYSILDLDLFLGRSFSQAVILDWDGVSRKRYTYNGAIMDHQPAGDVLERIRAEFSMVYRDYGSYVWFGFIQPLAASVFTFDEAAQTLIVGEEGETLVSIMELPVGDVPNRVYFSFLDETNGFEKTTFHLESQTQITKAGKVIDEQKFFTATTNIGQAMRIASNYMERTISGNYYASWPASIDALAVEVGDLVTVVNDLINGGTEYFLVTAKTIKPDFRIDFEGQLYRDAFYDDTVTDHFEDIIRGTPENPLRLCDECTDLIATETAREYQGKTYSDVTVEWTAPSDPIYRETEIWARDYYRDADTSWRLMDVANNGVAHFSWIANEFRTIRIIARSASRYGTRRAMDNTDLPYVDLILDGTNDNDVPDAPANLQVLTIQDDATIPLDTYRVTFDAGANNWAGVHTLFLETVQALPFSDGTQQVSNSEAVAGAAGTIEAGGNIITDLTKNWTPHDPFLVGCIAKLTDGLGHVQGRMVTDNTATTLTVSGPWYRISGDYAYEVVSNFALENLKAWTFDARMGDFDPTAGSWSFDLPMSGAGLYWRVCAFNNFGISEFATTASGSTSSSPDTGVPTVPLSIRLFNKGTTLCVAWEPPASNIASLTGYIVFLTTELVTGGPGSWNMTSYQWFNYPPNVHYAEIQAEVAGRYAAGVKAVNSWGESNLAVATKDST